MTATEHDEPDLEAGDFASWMTQIGRAVRGESGSDVPCDGCTACCSSSQFVHIGPEESDALAHIPKELLFQAPRLPRGHVLMGYDQNGKCPMLIDEQCSIYDHRPLTCRTYDCRVFPATGLDAGDDKRLIAARARRWKFTFTGDDDRELRVAVRAAATYLHAHPDVIPGGSPITTTQLAVRAIEAHEVFLHGVEDPDPEAVRVALRQRPS